MTMNPADAPDKFDNIPTMMLTRALSFCHVKISDVTDYVKNKNPFRIITNYMSTRFYIEITTFRA